MTYALIFIGGFAAGYEFGCVWHSLRREEQG